LRNTHQELRNSCETHEFLVELYSCTAKRNLRVVVIEPRRFGYGRSTYHHTPPEESCG
jgi:hypothetical protein